MLPTITAVAEPRPDGERIVRAEIQLGGVECDINEIAIVGRTITDRWQEGDKVILALSEDDDEAFVIPKMKPPVGGPGGPGGPGRPGGPGGNGPRPKMPEKKRKPVEVTAVIPGAGEVVSTLKEEKVIDSFVTGAYKDFSFSIFSPEVRDGEKYPLVVFIPDASPNGSDPLLALSQGIGATVWAEEENQKKHPCYVLAIEVPKSIHLTNDDFVVAPEYDQIKELIDKVVAENAVDTSRIYMTGQSQGCMSTFEMNCRYPDFLTASLCVSGQWDPVKVGKLINNKIFMGLSEGGPKEYPGMNAIFDELTANGAKTTRFKVSFRDGWDKINETVNASIGDANIIMCIFDKDTIWPDDGKEHRPMEHHNRGWEVVYQMESAREWLFAQKK